MKNNKAAWIIWSVLSLGVLVYFAYVLFADDDKKVFTPGEMIHGHYQIELACSSCHSDEFGGGEVLQNACVDCHGAELKAIDDSHPKSKFTNPRNASRVKQLDARECVTCHSEHKQSITGEMGVTIPEDFCFKCHSDVAEERPSHEGMGFETCASAGCHNYHDNSALYEDFLEKHIGQSAQLEQQLMPEKSSAEQLVLISRYPVETYPLKKLSAKDSDADLSLMEDSNVQYHWESTAHAAAGVNCSACHQVKDQSGIVKWEKNPGFESCQTCHAKQVEGFLDSKHGMRLKAGLSPMSPALARQPMRPNAHDKSLTCNSCHSAHKFDTQTAAVDSCLGCHADDHSKAFKQSPHFKTWFKASNGQAPENSGVSCATCHMPATEIKAGDHELFVTEHNQSLNLRPNEKMLRSVCMNCHGLGFAIDALADKALIKNNFSGQPSVHIESIDMVEKRAKEKRQKGSEGED